MRISLTYIHHNCFVLRTPQRAFLFDYPDDGHLPDGAEDMVRQAVAGADLAVFISHSHDDHLNDDIVSMTTTATSVRYVLSDDVEDMRPEVIPTGAEVLIVEPDETYEFHGMTIETLMSNDLGVAFLVADGDFRFYYGGDLAKWIWKGGSSSEREFTERFFSRAMHKVREFSPHVAFSNVDKRLENLAGGLDAYCQTGAQVFVPMHAFGDTEWLSRCLGEAGESASQLFLYAQSGDSADFDV